MFVVSVKRLILFPSFFGNTLFPFRISALHEILSNHGDSSIFWSTKLTERDQLITLKGIFTCFQKDTKLHTKV